MPKVLVILGMYQPRPSANGICIEKIVETLSTNGYEVECIANHEANSEIVDKYNGINVYRVKTRLVYRLTEWLEYHPTSRFNRLAGLLCTAMNKAKLLFSLPSWPVISKSYTRRFTEFAKKLHYMNHYDIVIGTYAPIDAVYAACNLKKYDARIRCVTYFLDSLSGGYGLKILPPEATLKRCLKHEKYLMQIADKVIIMKSSYEHNLKHNLEFQSKIAVLDIPLLSNIENSIQTPVGSRIKFVYAGSISVSTRDPSFLIQLLCAISNPQFEISFVGPVDCLGLFDPLKAAYGERLRITGRVDHEIALHEMKTADFLLNIGNLNPSMVPSKIFEYLSMRKPILTTFSIKNEPSLDYLRKYPLTFAIDESRKDFDTLVMETMNFVSENRGRTIDCVELERLFPLNTPKAFVDVLDNMLGE